MLGCNGGSLLFIYLREGGDGDDHLLHGLAVCGDHRCDVIEKNVHGVGHLGREGVVDDDTPSRVVWGRSGWLLRGGPSERFAGFRCST